jgi:hypothetical protein
MSTASRTLPAFFSSSKKQNIKAKKIIKKNEEKEEVKNHDFNKLIQEEAKKQELRNQEQNKKIQKQKEIMERIDQLRIAREVENEPQEDEPYDEFSELHELLLAHPL